jgi:Ca2+-binding RTX toxin-like protein
MGGIRRIAAGGVVAVALTAAQLMFGASAAHALSVGIAQVQGSTLTFTAYPNLANSVEVSADATAIYLTDIVNSIDVGPGCSIVVLPQGVAGGKVSCVKAGVVAIVVSGSNQADKLGVRGTLVQSVPSAFAGRRLASTTAAIRITLLGGPGDDYIYAADDPADLFGEDGNDILLGGQAADRLMGGAGADQLTGSSSPYPLAGAAGYDYLDGGADQPDVCVPSTSGALTVNCESILH